VYSSLKPLLNPDLTASWEKGLTYVAEGTITPDEYMTKLEDFIKRRVGAVMELRNEGGLQAQYRSSGAFYTKKAAPSSGKKSGYRSYGRSGSAGSGRGIAGSGRGTAGSGAGKRGK